MNIFVKKMEKFKELLALTVYTQYTSQSPINKKTKNPWKSNRIKAVSQVTSSSSSSGTEMQKL